MTTRESETDWILRENREDFFPRVSQSILTDFPNSAGAGISVQKNCKIARYDACINNFSQLSFSAAKPLSQTFTMVIDLTVRRVSS